VFALAVLVPALAAAQNNDAALKKGSETVGKACQACHGNIARMLQVERRSADQWRNTVYSMIGRGAHIFPDEIEPLVAHLTTIAGPSTPRPEARVLPEGAGKAILERACQQCHNLDTATRRPVGRDWSTLLRTMTTYGAMITPAEEKTLNDYLERLAPAAPAAGGR
jgi:cytochrome c5